MTKTRNPAVAMTPGLESDFVGSDISQEIALRRINIKQSEPVTYEGRLLGFVRLAGDGRANATTRTGLELGRFNSAAAAARALLQQEVANAAV